MDFGGFLNAEANERHRREIRETQPEARILNHRGTARLTPQPTRMEDGRWRMEKTCSCERIRNLPRNARFLGIVIQRHRAKRLPGKTVECGIQNDIESFK